MAIEASRSTLPVSSFSTMSSSSASAVSKFMPAISALAASVIALVLVFLGDLDGRKLARPAHQGLHMHAHRCGKCCQVIAAFKHRDNAAIGVLVGHFHDVERCPDEIFFAQFETAQRIPAMGIETGGNDH